jgi:hypothetical protein
MSKTYTRFDAQDDVIVAESDDPDHETIRIESNWFENEPGEKGRWEEVVGAVIRNDLLGEMNLGEGEGSIGRGTAIENLLDSDLVAIEDQAHAMLDYFEREGAVVYENGRVRLLTDPEQLQEEDADFGKNGRRFRMLSWAAAMDACIDRMESKLQEFEQARDRLRENTDRVANERSQAEDTLNERLHELRALGPGSDIPSPDQLDGEKLTEFRQLKEDIEYYSTLVEVEQTTIMEVDGQVDQLASEIERLRAAKGTFDRKVAEVRQRALHYELFPEEALGMAKNFSDLVASMSGVSAVDDTDLDVDEIKDLAEQQIGSVSEMADAIDEDTMAEVDERTSTDTSINQ